MNENEELTGAEIICWCLRAKTGYGTTEGGSIGWPLIDTGTMVFRCTATMQPFGPDGGQATYERCRPGRKCFRLKAGG